MSKKPFRKSDFRPAVKDPVTDKIYTGEDHHHALREAEIDGNFRVGMKHAGFQYKNGKFFTRDQTDKEYGFRTSQDLRP